MPAGKRTRARAQALRVVLLELERLYNHIADIGALATDVAFTVPASRAQAQREGLVRLYERLFGTRLLRGTIALGGVKQDLTPLENLAVARALGKPSETTLEKVLEQVDLYGYEDVLTRNLSAGQQRRLALARLLVVDAPLWILDEPFTSLDVHGIGLIESLLEEHIHQSGMLAMTSHHTVNLVNAPVHHINLSA